jgi:hypothetical protein
MYRLSLKAFCMLHIRNVVAVGILEGTLDSFHEVENCASGFCTQDFMMCTNRT